MSKTKFRVILAICSAFFVALLMIGYLVFFHGQSDTTSKPISTIAPPSVNDETSIEELRKTTQFKDIAFVENQYAQFLSNGTLNGVNAEELNLSIWTIDKYIHGAITNPYFISGYWEDEDSLALNSIEKYITPYISQEQSETLISEVAALKTNGVSEALASKIFLPDPQLTIPEKCYDTWQDDYCLASLHKIDKLSYVGQSDGSIKINVEVIIAPLYQTPDAPEGSVSSQERRYALEFIVIRANEPDSDDTKIPIMTISEVRGSVAINGLQNYLTNEG